MPYLTSSPSELAKNVIRKLTQLTFASARESAQVSGLVKCEAQVRRDTVQALSNLLTGALSQFNVGHNMSPTQVAILANDLLGTYWYWRFDEFAYVLGQAIRGKWGTVYNRLDMAVVNEWCQQYGADREALLVLESEERAKAYKRAEQNGPAPVPAGGPAAQALRQQLAALSNEQLQAGLDYYAALPEPTPEQALKLQLATEEAGERNRIAWATYTLSQFRRGGELRTQAEREAQAKLADHRLQVALLRGDWQAAGFSSVPSAEWLALVQAPVNEPFDAPQHQVFPPACPKCTQRPEQCVC